MKWSKFADDDKVMQQITLLCDSGTWANSCYITADRLGVKSAFSNFWVRQRSHRKPCKMSVQNFIASCTHCQDRKSTDSISPLNSS